MLTALTTMFRERMRVRLLLLSLGIGMAGASIMPVLSTHLAVNLLIEPFWIGVLFGSNTIAGISVSHWIAKQSDAGLSRIKIIRIGLEVSLVMVIALGVSTPYFLVLLFSVLMFAAVSPIQPQLFALARTLVDDEQATLFQSMLRSTISLSWIIGPPLAYVLFASIGFLGLALICATLFAFTLLSVRGFKDIPLQTNASVAPSTRDPRLKWMVLAIAGVFASNNMYLVYMPIYAIETLQLAAVAPGLLMGLAAGIEIPIMLTAGAQANRWRLFSPLKLAAASGVIFYLLVFFSDQLNSLLFAQLFNGLFIGVMAGLGISVFQTLMQGRMGMASTLYTNAIRMGGLAGSLGGGMIAQFAGLRGVFLACVVMSIVSLFALHRASALRLEPTKGLKVNGQ